MKIRSFIPWVALVFLCVAPVAKAQTGAPQGGANSSKIAVIRMREAIVATAEGKQASAELQSKFAPMQADIVNIQKQADDINKLLQAGSNTLSEEEKERKNRALKVLSDKYGRLTEELQEESTADQNEVIERIGKRMLDVQERYARENGYALVIDSSGQTLSVLYAAKSIDITEEIVKLYDQQFPVKVAAAPAPKQPGQQQPPQTPPAKKPGGQQ